MRRNHLSKEEVRSFARDLGVELVGFAPVSRWEKYRDLDKAFFPQNIWPLSKTVIALAVPSLLPITETKIPHLYQYQYLNTNSLLDEKAYRLTAFLNRNGYASINICRDGYGDLNVLRRDPTAIFSHVWAGYYAGLGSV